jgi:hypothetical protein
VKEVNSYHVWFDDGRDSLEKKIKAAIESYRRKYNTPPVECLLNITYSELPQIEGVIITTVVHVKPNFVWLTLPSESKTAVIDYVEEEN